MNGHIPKSSHASSPRIAMVIECSLDVFVGHEELPFAEQLFVSQLFLGILEQIGTLEEGPPERKTKFALAHFTLRVECEKWELNDESGWILMELKCPSCTNHLISYIDKKLIGLFRQFIPNLEIQVDQQQTPYLHGQISCKSCFDENEIS